MAKGKKTGGREKGTPNRTTREFRETVRLLLESNAENVSAWLDMVAQTDPGRALDLLCKLAEYASPKLARSELAAGDGGPLQVIINDPTLRARAAAK